MGENWGGNVRHNSQPADKALKSPPVTTHIYAKASLSKQQNFCVSFQISCQSRNNVNLILLTYLASLIIFCILTGLSSGNSQLSRVVMRRLKNSAQY